MSASGDIYQCGEETCDRLTRQPVFGRCEGCWTSLPRPDRRRIIRAAQKAMKSTYKVRRHQASGGARP